MSIETFSLTRERCTLTHLNIRTEMHGEEQKPAIDLAFEFSSANNLLSKLHPDLRAAFYRKDDNRDLIDGDHLPALRFPLLGSSFSWEVEIPRTLLRVHAEGGADIVLGGGKTNKIRIELLEGGTVKWKFRCQFSQPKEDDIAALSGLLAHTIPVSLECAAEEETVDLFDQVEQQTQEPMSEARLQAEALFSTPGAAVETLPATGEVVHANLEEDGTCQAAALQAVVDKVADAEQSNVEPIEKRRSGKRVSNGSNLE